MFSTDYGRKTRVFGLFHSFQALKARMPDGQMGRVACLAFGFWRLRDLFISRHNQGIHSGSFPSERLWAFPAESKMAILSNMRFCRCQSRKFGAETMFVRSGS